MKVLKEIKGVFKPPSKKYYIGKIAHGCPYFYPINFCPTIFKMRKLKLRAEEEYQSIIKDEPWLKERKRFLNLPMVRRSKDWILKLFGHWWWLQVGWPISIKNVDLGWKDKFDSPRYEWSPQFHIYFFIWQFSIFWTSPVDRSDDDYYEQILWWLKYSNKDIELAETSWPWQNCNTKESTWNKKYLL